MRSISKLIWLAAFLFIAPLAHAAERAVFLPVSGEMLASEKAQLADEVAKSLSWQYQVILGDKVNEFVTKVFREESKKLDCDETSCYRRIAAEFKAEKIITLKIAKISSGKYLLTFNLYDVNTGEVVKRNRAECNECSFGKLLVTAQTMMGGNKSSP